MNAKSKAASILGSIKSEAKARASRENGKLGGRPNNTIAEDLDVLGIPLEEMARVSPGESGLPMTVIILNGEGLPHGPRIKVCTILGGKVSRDCLVQVTIEDEPKFIGKNASQLSSSDKNKITKFIQINKKILADHYFGKLTDKQTLNALRSI